MLGKVGSNVANAATWGFGATRKSFQTHFPPFFGLHLLIPFLSIVGSEAAQSIF